MIYAMIFIQMGLKHSLKHKKSVDILKHWFGPEIKKSSQVTYIQNVLEGHVSEGHFWAVMQKSFLNKIFLIYDSELIQMVL